MGIFLAGSLIQIGAIILHDSSRYRGALGAGAKLLVRILGGQIYLGTLLGANVLSATMGSPGAPVTRFHRHRGNPASLFLLPTDA